MEEGDKSIGIDGETSKTTRVSADSPSWLFASRQRFTIELRPDETTIVSWKRLVKDAQKTEDSLDECFQDDKSTSKQNGLLVNSDKLECINETVLPVAQLPRKRSKNMAEAQGENDHVPSKHAKVEKGRLNFAGTDAVLEDQFPALLQNLAANREPDQKSHYLSTSSVRSIRKPINIGTKSEHSSDTGVSNKDTSIFPSNSKDADKYKSVTIGSSNLENNTNSLETHQKYRGKKSCKKFESPVRKLVTANDEDGISAESEQKKKRATCGELPDLNLPVYPVQSEKNPSLQSKDVSKLRPKGTMLERAMKELEKVVAESRLSTMEVQDIDASSAAIKRRLPCEVKQKLAKVARLALSSQGKISKELINRLMNILGHLVEMRTLKRNLKEIILMELSAKREKAARCQQMKLEVTEMIKLQASNLGDVATGDIQDVRGSEEKIVLRKRYNMDNTMEDKICDLYDLYIEGMDDDKGPQIRELYVQLAELWPDGIMDKHGIKTAICRAKERKRASCESDKVREDGRKKSQPKREVGVRGEACSVSQVQAVQENQASAISSHILALPCPSISCKETLGQHLAAPLEICSVSPNPSMDITEEEKIEKMTIPLLKEQMKQKEKMKSRMKKSSMKLEKESRKSHKQSMPIRHSDAASYKISSPQSCEHPV